MQLVVLLGNLGKSVKEAREMGKKFGVVESANKGKGKGGYMSMGGGVMDDMWDTKGDGAGSNGEGLSVEGGYVL